MCSRNAYVCVCVCIRICTYYIINVSSKVWALAGVAQWIESGPTKQRVAGSIPSHGTCLGCGPGPLWGAHERHPPTSTFLCLFFSLPSL